MLVTIVELSAQINSNDITVNLVFEMNSNWYINARVSIAVALCFHVTDQISVTL